jgi:hypothetical protein
MPIHDSLQERAAAKHVRRIRAVGGGPWLCLAFPGIVHGRSIASVVRVLG